MIAALLLAVAAETAASGAPAAPVEPDPKAMSQTEIRAHNATVSRNDPFYIRCVRSAEIGSLVKRNYSCRTNRQWIAAEEAGNREVRDVMEHTKSKSWNTSG